MTGDRIKKAYNVYSRNFNTMSYGIHITHTIITYTGRRNDLFYYVLMEPIRRHPDPSWNHFNFCSALWFLERRHELVVPKEHVVFHYNRGKSLTSR